MKYRTSKEWGYERVNLKDTDSCVDKGYNKQGIDLRKYQHYSKSLWAKVRVHGRCGGKRMVGLRDECGC